ncbi:unnamed protein product [Rotaria sordida]|uniref:Peptidase M14 domain-containing protein n=1 Tax=Rotaria sordida TaxID=392033 RepID=A0A814XVG1_9BILA|nr:unnamed protein product [Rotaria sordida]CAF1500809.1 unnamed protein product [Rotaria sordida]
MAIRHDGTKATTKKAVWWDGGIHAREWISPATVIYIAYAFLSKYGQDPTITHLVDQFDCYILPVFNVDGYAYTWTKAYTTMKPSQFKLQDDGSIQAINALAAVHGTQYQHDNIAQTIYVASGSTVDWTYGTANVIFSYGVELRDTGKYGFLLPEDQIIPSGEETLAGLLALLQYIEKQVYV